MSYKADVLLVALSIILWSGSTSAQTSAINFRSCSAVAKAYDAALWAILRNDVFSNEQLQRELLRYHYDMQPDIFLLTHIGNESISASMQNLLDLPLSPFEFLRPSVSEDPPRAESLECFRNRDFPACMTMYALVTDTINELHQSCISEFAVD